MQPTVNLFTATTLFVATLQTDLQRETRVSETFWLFKKRIMFFKTCILFQPLSGFNMLLNTQNITQIPPWLLYEPLAIALTSHAERVRERSIQSWFAGTVQTLLTLATTTNSSRRLHKPAEALMPPLPDSNSSSLLNKTQMLKPLCLGQQLLLGHSPLLCRWMVCQVLWCLA